VEEKGRNVVWRRGDKEEKENNQKWEEFMQYKT
jgi:hypothetical protein